MSRRKANAPAVKVKLTAFTLPELLICLTLAAFVLLAVSRFYSSHFRVGKQQQLLLELQQHSHRLLNYLQPHIQHSGYQSEKRSSDNFALFQNDGKSHRLHGDHCLILLYDLDGDGCIGSRRTKTAQCRTADSNNSRNTGKELFGFKSENGALYQYSESKALENCSASQCQTVLNDCSKGWKNLTEQETFVLEKLHFEWLEKDKLLKTELRLRAYASPDIRYTATAYTYLLNGDE